MPFNSPLGNFTFGRPLPGQTYRAIPLGIQGTPAPAAPPPPAPIEPKPLRQTKPPPHPLPPTLSGLEGHPYVVGANPPGQSPPSIIVAQDKTPRTFREGVAMGAELALYVQGFRAVAAIGDTHLLHLGGLAHRVPGFAGRGIGPVTGIQLQAGSLVTDSAALGSFFITPRPFGLLPPRLAGLPPDYNRGINPYATGVKVGGRAVLEFLALLDKVAASGTIPHVIGVQQLVAQGAIASGLIGTEIPPKPAGPGDLPSVNPKDP